MKNSLRLHAPKRYIRGAGFIMWHARHEFYHILLGLAWAWFLREKWNEFNGRWIFFAMFGSLLPDGDHLVYFVTWGKKESYAKQAIEYFRAHQWRNLVQFLEDGHKNLTNLASHNYYFMAILLATALLSSLFEWRVGVILFGAMLIHYLFDLIDDLVVLGSVNSSWRRWGRPK